MHILFSENNSDYLAELYGLFIDEWGNIDSFDENEYGNNPPKPIVVVNGRELIGGLSFTWHQPKGFSDIKLWINALYVKPDFRGKGIAKSLIKAAVGVADLTNESELFVYTHIPQLYTSLGWCLTQDRGENKVLKTALNKVSLKK